MQKFDWMKDIFNLLVLATATAARLFQAVVDAIQDGMNGE